MPTEEVVEMRGVRSAAASASFSRVMCWYQMELGDDTWHLVKETPRVMGFIGGKADAPAPITDAEAAAILQRVQDGAEARHAEDCVRARRTGTSD